ncbi:MAG: response regulator, partial [Candidatus Omnitrophota bacterium]
MEEKKAKILVVDDEPEMVAILKHFLQLKGYEAIGALSGEEALRILEREGVDLVLLDIMMPGIKGTEIAKTIREKYPASKIIVVSGYSNEIEKLSKDSPLEGAFVKPINVGELYDKLIETCKKEPPPLRNAKLD